MPPIQFVSTAVLSPVPLDNNNKNRNWCWQQSKEYLLDTLVVTLPKKENVSTNRTAHLSWQEARTSFNGDIWKPNVTHGQESSPIHLHHRIELWSHEILQLNNILEFYKIRPKLFALIVVNAFWSALCYLHTLWSVVVKSGGFRSS